MAENIKNLCAPIPTELHAQLRQRQEESGQTLSQYMTWLITKFYEEEEKPTCIFLFSMKAVLRIFLFLTEIIL